jgi:xylulokinase
MLFGLAAGLDAVQAHGITARRILLIGGAAQSAAVRAVAPTVFGLPVAVPEPAEHVALGAARQAAWVLAGTEEPPAWSENTMLELAAGDVSAGQELRHRHLDIRELVHHVPVKTGEDT